ncbi:MAG TPA: hypothetical protein VF064_01830 [Pyrinomonadaceae bacterium]
MTNLSKARSAGLACMLGGLLILYTFVVLNPPTEASSGQAAPYAFPAVWTLALCVAAVCLAQALAGRFALETSDNGGRKAPKLSGGTTVRPRLRTSFLDKVFIDNFPERAFQQLSPPGGPVLLTHDMFWPGWAAPPFHLTQRKPMPQMPQRTPTGS